MVLPGHAWIELNVSKAAKSSTPASADLGKGYVCLLSFPYHSICRVRQCCINVFGKSKYRDESHRERTPGEANS